MLFRRTGGHYLFWTGCLYLLAAMVCAFNYKNVPATAIQAVWVLTLGIPFVIPPFGRWLNMDIDWDRKMFDWLKNRNKENQGNVVKFPELKTVPPMPEVEPPKKEEPAKIYYRLGLTDNNRVAFQMGYSEITMNHEGCQQLIDQLTFFQNQLREENDAE